MNLKLKWGTAKRLSRRSAVILGAVGLAASAGMLATAGSALAAVGTVPGGLQLLQTGVVLGSSGGPLTTTTTWNSTTACPSGFQTSADLTEWTVGGTPTEVSVIAPVTGVGLSSPNFTGSLLGTPGALLNTGGINASNPGTLEWVIGCYSGASATGSVSYIGDTFISVASGATNFTLSNTGPVVATTTTQLVATPNPVAVGATATLTATEVASDSTHPAGSVQFEAGGTDIGTPVAVNASGVATTTTTFSAAGSEALSAVFTPTNTTGYSGSTGTFSLAVGSQLASGTNPVSISVTVPSTGTLSVTVATGSVTLSPASPSTTPDETATGTFNNVTISDSRNTFPGWSVSGQESVFQGPGTDTIPANSLGWTPAFVGSAVGGATIGAAVPPVGANSGSTGPGLGTAATLAQATPGNGFGTNVVNAALLLDIPSSTPPGAYAGQLTVTYVTAGP
jgi:Bacterial Ig-like domain (group 3)